MPSEANPMGFFEREPQPDRLEKIADAALREKTRAERAEHARKDNEKIERVCEKHRQREASWRSVLDKMSVKNPVRSVGESIYDYMGSRGRQKIGTMAYNGILERNKIVDRALEIDEKNKGSREHDDKIIKAFEMLTPDKDHNRDRDFDRDR